MESDAEFIQAIKQNEMPSILSSFPFLYPVSFSCRRELVILAQMHLHVLAVSD
jgi:hypothetical protein